MSAHQLEGTVQVELIGSQSDIELVTAILCERFEILDQSADFQKGSTVRRYIVLTGDTQSAERQVGQDDS